MHVQSLTQAMRIVDMVKDWRVESSRQGERKVAKYAFEGVCADVSKVLQLSPI